MPPLARLLLAVTVAVAVLDWVVVAARSGPGSGSTWLSRPVLEYVAKPATMVALAAFVVALTWDGPQDRTQVWLWLAAIGFSLGGDVFLMLPSNLFLPGLASFLLAHLCYVAALGIGPLEGWSGPVLAALFVVIVAIPIARSVLSHIDSTPERAAVAAYMVVIAAMVISAWTLPWRAGVPLWAGLAGAIGASLFFASDAMIGHRRFVHDFRGADLAIIVTYHVGQIGLALSLVR